MIWACRFYNLTRIQIPYLPSILQYHQPILIQPCCILLCLYNLIPVHYIISYWGVKIGLSLLMIVFKKGESQTSSEPVRLEPSVQGFLEIVFKSIKNTQYLPPESPLPSSSPLTQIQPNEPRSEFLSSFEHP